MISTITEIYNNIFSRNGFKKIYCYFEVLAWSLLGIYVAIEGFKFITETITKEHLLNFLSNRIFYLIILLEVLKIISLRLTAETHMLIAYHFALMVFMGFAREVVLLQVMKIEIMIGLFISTIILGLMYYLSHILSEKSKIHTWFFKSKSSSIYLRIFSIF